MEVDVFIRVHQTVNKGQDIVLYRYKGKVKELYFSTLETTHNRSIILASKIGIEGLNSSCIVNLHTQCNFGFKFMENSKKWVNRDVGDLLAVAIAEGGHKVNFIDCSATEEGKDYQQALEVKLRGFRA